MKKTIFLSATLYTLAGFSQNSNDSIKVKLNEIEIVEILDFNGKSNLSEMKDNIIYAGKKTDVIHLNKIDADLTTNNSRQIFSKVPGISIWENDGSGIQVGVASRGLSPNRSWEFNVRQNGYDISAEIFGYPEAYYNPPMEAVERIEIVRGASSLQFGPQFGGLLNYQIKKGHPSKAISLESYQTLGSYGLFNSFNGIGGTINKFSYYGYFQFRTADGWRENSFYKIFNGYFSAKYQFTNYLSLEAEYTKMEYLSQQSGGLTDQLFKQNPRQSLRKRNWFNVPWNIGAITLKYDITKNINLQIKGFTIIAERNSVGFIKPINIKDTINSTTLDYSPRQVDRDFYKNFGAEARMSIKYKFIGNENILAGGFRVYNGNIKRNQLGSGTTGMNFDLTLTNPKYGRSFDLGTNNYAVFAENIFKVGNRLKFIPGIRYEIIENSISGYSTFGTINPDKRYRQILLMGIGSEFLVTKNTQLYSNYSQGYRPTTFSELTPSATNEIIDPNLKDASGFNFDFGYRGNIKKFLNFDVSVFYLLYDNRIGTIKKDGAPFRTNIGTSVSKGVESFIEIDLIKIFTDSSRFGNISFFASNAFIDAKYTKWNNPEIINDPTKSIQNKRVENAPEYIHRFGITYYHSWISVTLLYNKVGDVYTDAANTELPNNSATIGKINSYQLMDLSMKILLSKQYSFKVGINNLTDEKYATRRAGGYPGPGLIPGNGRTFYFTLGVNI